MYTFLTNKRRVKKTRTVSMSTAIEAMKISMRRDENVILIGEDVAGGAQVDHLQDDEAWGGVLGVTKGLGEFGRNRILDTPISEAGYMGAAMAAAATGLRPIAELMFNDFIGSCLDQVLNQGAKFVICLEVKQKYPLQYVRCMALVLVQQLNIHKVCTHYLRAYQVLKLLFLPHRMMQKAYY